MRSSFRLDCEAIPIRQVAEIFKTPNETVGIDIFHLNPATTLGEVHIPANFLSYRHVTENLSLECPSDPNEIEQVPITIDPNAFNSSSDYLREIIISNCDLGRLDFSFLIGFDLLNFLKIRNPSSIEKANWNLLPSLPSLIQLEITNYKELNNNWNDWTQALRPLTNGLNRLICYASVDDEAADRLVQWLLNSSATTLQRLELRQTKMTKIPPGISNFRNLATELIITCSDSEMNALEENSIKFEVLPMKIQISGCGIRKLQPGAIQGKNTKLKYVACTYICN